FIPLDKDIPVFIWLLVWNSLFNLFYGYLCTPWQSWMPEITTEDDRVAMSGLQNTSNLLATVGGLAFAFIFSGKLDEAIKNEGPTAIFGPLGVVLLVAVIIFAFIEVVSFLPALLSIREEPVQRKERNIMREFKIVLTNKNYVLWFITQGIYSMGLTILTALTFNLISFLGLTGIKDFAIFAVFMFGTTMLSFIFWEKMSKRIGKKKGLFISFGCLILVLPLTLVLGHIPYIPDNIEVWVFGLLLGFGLSTTYLFPNAIIGDLADQDERITKESRAGMYTGFNSIPLNIFQASAYLLIPFIYDPEPGAVYLGLKWLGPIVAAFFFLSLPVAFFGNFDPFLDIIKQKKAVKQKNEERVD
ncbi:MAG: MFS transporter, partial [Candidatus Heimdallarchaeaceae archaeon]